MHPSLPGGPLVSLHAFSVFLHEHACLFGITYNLICIVILLVGLEPEIKSIPSLFPYPQSQGEGSKFWVYMGLTYMK